MTDKFEPALPKIDVVYKCPSGINAGSLAVEFTFYYEDIQYGAETDEEVYGLAMKAMDKRLKDLRAIDKLNLAEQLLHEREMNQPVK